MRKLFDNYFREDFADGAARAAYAHTWANQQEEKGKHLRGDAMDLAPTTPLSAYVWAGELIGALTAANNASIYMLGVAAAKADGVEDIDAKEFGHYIAMQSLDKGVGWFDNHADFPMKVPYLEYNLP